MAQYRKKPVVIEAMQWNGNYGNIQAWLKLNGVDASNIYKDYGKSLRITTLEGNMRARRGDWIIRGIQGELYPCKPDIFEQTYELVELR